MNSGNSEIRGSYLLAGSLQGDLHPSDVFGFCRTGGWELGLGIGDLNGDGRADLAVLRGPILDWYEFHVYGPPSINAPPSQPNAILRPDQTGGSAQAGRGIPAPSRRSRVQLQGPAAEPGRTAGSGVSARRWLAVTGVAS